MSKPNNKQWQEFKDQFNGLLGDGYLECDGYLVAVHLRRYKNRLVHAVYINGLFKGKWVEVVDEDKIDTLQEEARRFLMPSRMGLSAKEIKSYEKAFGKRECKKMGIYKKKVVTSPCWNSINSFVTHVKKHNDNIEILTYDEYKAREENLLIT